MSTILFTWELGRGSGHVTPYRALIAELAKRGDRVVFAARNVERTDAVLGDLVAEIFQAPMHLQRQAVVAEATSYPKILLNCGFASAESVLARCRAWRRIYDACNPDLVIYDHSPTALAAFRGSTARGVVSGNGFLIPPPGPLPDLKRARPADAGVVTPYEIQVLEVLNEAFEALEVPPLGILSDLWASKERFLFDVRELDPYRRPQHDFLGVYPSPAVGQKLDWPDVDGPKVFGYLHGNRNLPDLLAILRGMPLCAFIVCPDLAADLAGRFENERLRIAHTPVDLSALGGQCAVALTSGTHGATLAALLAGVPVLVMPDSLETMLIGRCVAELGAGRVVQGSNPREVKQTLDGLLADPTFACSARAFAARYARHSAEELTRTLLARIDRILH